MWLPHDTILICHVHVFCIIPLLQMHKFCSTIVCCGEQTKLQNCKATIVTALRLVIVNACLVSPELLTAKMAAPLHTEQ